jgi:hypothetical protein
MSGRSHELPHTANDAKKINSVASDFIFSSQILSVRRQKRVTPDWVSDDKQVQALLLRVFPKLKIDLNQRQKAGRWARFIQLYFKTGLSYREVAEEMGERKETIHTLRRRVVRAQRGQPLNGVKRKNKSVPQLVPEAESKIKTP